jgi:hypothetical protein
MVIFQILYWKFEMLSRKAIRLGNFLNWNMVYKKVTPEIEEYIQKDMSHALDTIRQKEEMVSFLQSYIAQLTQSISQLALPPTKDEARRKGRSWKFWR